MEDVSMNVEDASRYCHENLGARLPRSLNHTQLNLLFLRQYGTKTWAQELVSCIFSASMNLQLFLIRKHRILDQSRDTWIPYLYEFGLRQCNLSPLGGWFNVEEHRRYFCYNGTLFMRINPISFGWSYENTNDQQRLLDCLKIGLRSVLFYIRWVIFIQVLKFSWDWSFKRLGWIVKGKKYFTTSISVLFSSPMHCLWRSQHIEKISWLVTIDKY